MNCAGSTALRTANAGAVQIRSQLAFASLSPSSGQPWQSGIDIAMSSAIAFALTACTIVLAANTARNRIAKKTKVEETMGSKLYKALKEERGPTTGVAEDSE